MQTPSADSQRIYAPGILRDQVVIVTGGGSGIGLATALEMARLGAKVAICGRTVDKLEAARAQLVQIGSVLAQPCDIREPSQVEQFVRAVIAQWGRIDIVVNNAGVLGTWRLGETTDEQWQRVIDVNLTGVFRMTRAAMPLLLESERGGRVISVASITPLRGEARTSAYAASKGGVIGFTKALSREVAHRGVTVNGLAPGYIETEQTAATFAGEHRDSILGQVTMREFGTPADVAGAAVYLASDAARYVTGQILVVDGGVV